MNRETEAELQELHRLAGKLNGELSAMVDALPNPLHRQFAKQAVMRFHEIVVRLIKLVEKNGR